MTRWNHAFETVRARLHNRAFAYRAVFLVKPAPGSQDDIDSTPWWAFWRKPAERREINPAGDIVLRDLARYCYASQSTLKISQATQQSDALSMAFAEGRRDVFNRIVAMCNLNHDQIDRIAYARTNQDE